jgi:hypothetical protein
LNAADNRATVLAEAAAVVGPLEKAQTSSNAADRLAAYYKNGKAVGGSDPLAMAEIEGALRQVRS